MIAVAWADLNAWSSRRARFSLLAVSACLTAAGILFRLRPELWGQALTISLLWVGWQVGAEKWIRLKSWDWIRQERLGIARIVAGKFTAALLLIILHALPALPLLVTMVYVWGIPWVRLFRLVIFIMTASWLIAALIFLADHMIWLGQQVTRILLGGGWLVLSAAVPFLRPLNPFIFTGRLLLPGPLASIVPGLLANLALTFFSALLLWQYNKKRFKAARAGAIENSGGGV
ncbi:MAG TPA: hypothetical protein GXZ26_04980 [Firmicutes bacterium]|jgi:hypothetical protein|nr:hypothetical protein [Bacillota bacterium]